MIRPTFFVSLINFEVINLLKKMKNKASIPFAPLIKPENIENIVALKFFRFKTKLNDRNKK
jgi:hypothetical protein